ncbi:MAG: CHAT domain-containing protein [Lyngbya sp. HA4199-MV5]|jgi:CHAT domain-containing protein/tetratricopeptide (TPR) repeat protein|nr:CHAT domain-containing protein [Lyngbya sp. HA4199-MV5]
MLPIKFAIALTLLAAPVGLLLPTDSSLIAPALAQTTKARQAEADRLLEQGLSQFQTGGIEAAFQSWQQALTIYRSLKDRLGEGKALGNLGIAYRILGDFDQAIAAQQQYLAIARELKDRESEGMALGNLGNIAYLLGQFDNAIDYQQQWLAIARETKDRQSEGKALGNLGNIYESLGDYAKTIDYTQQWLAIARETKDRQSEAKAIGNLGVVSHSSGDYASAISYGQQQLAIARAIKDRQTEGAALGNLGNAYYALGEYEKAINHEQQLLTIARDIKDIQSEAAALGNLGNVLLALGQYDKAADYHQQQLDIVRRLKNRQSEAIALGNLSTATFFVGAYTRTIEYGQQALAIAQQLKDRQTEGKVLGNLGNAYLVMGDTAKAIDHYQQQLAIARAIKARPSEGAALNNLGYALLRSGNLAEAERTLFAGIQLWESLRAGLGSDDISKVSLFDEQARTYRTLQEVLIAQNKPGAALEIAERGRARAFVELLAQRLTTGTGDRQTEARSQPSPSTATIASPSLANIKQIARDQKATLVQYAIIYSEVASEGRQLPKEAELYIWVVKPSGDITFRKTDLKPLWQQNTSLRNLVTSSREAIGVRSRSVSGRSNRRALAAQAQPLQTLHQLLIQPIADLLPTDPNQRLIFIPQGTLFLVPFPALQDPQGKYLIEQHTLQTAPSIQVLGQIAALTRQQSSRNRNASHSSLVVGNPIMPKVPPAPGEPPEPLAPLPGAEKEARAIASLLQTQAITGKQATKTTIVQQMSRAQIIHLATHGLLDEQRGLESALAFAPEVNRSAKKGDRASDRANNGLLTAAEILTLPLNADLVVLSACDTGRGRITGDGVVGLARSFLAAGTSNLVVSLWAIPDAPTATLMTQFYRNLRQTNDKAQALRQAMLITMKTHPNPRDWAAFTLIGAGE